MFILLHQILICKNKILTIALTATLLIVILDYITIEGHTFTLLNDPSKKHSNKSNKSDDNIPIKK